MAKDSSGATEPVPSTPTNLPPKASPAMTSLSSPRASARRRIALPGEDDPQSELNNLRRELRKAQAELRESGLQASAHQEEVCLLRQELREAETARDDALARESELRQRLVAERTRINATMSAAESLVATLHAMEASNAAEDAAPYIDSEVDLNAREISPSDMDTTANNEQEVPVVSFEDLRVAASSKASPQLSASAVPRASSTPSIRPRSTKLLESAFSSRVPGEATAVRRAVSDEYAAGGLPVLSASAPASRLPLKVSSIDANAHAGDIFCAAASLDGALLATGGDDRVVRVTNLRAASPPATITGLPKSATAVEFLPDEAGTHAPLLAVGTADGAVRLFRRAPKRRARWGLDAVVPVHTACVRRIAFRPDAGEGTAVLTAGADRSLKLTDIRSGSRVFVAQAPSAAMDVAPLHGGAFVSCHRDGGVRLWSARAGKEITGEAARLHTRAAVAVAPLDDGRGIVSLGRDNALRVADTRMNLRVVHELEGGVETVSDWHRVAVDGRFAYCGIGPSGDLGVWNVDSGKMVKRISSVLEEKPSDVIEMVAKSFAKPVAIVVPLWSNAGRFLCAHKTRQVSFWDV